MERRNDGMIEFSDAELVILEWYSSLLESGFDHVKVLEKIRESVPNPGMTHRILQNGAFRAFLRVENADYDPNVFWREIREMLAEYPNNAYLAMMLREKLTRLDEILSSRPQN